MTSTKVKTLHDTIKFTSTYDTINSKLVVTTASNHLLVNGDLVTLVTNVVPQEFVNVAVTVTAANEFTVSIPNHTVSQGEVFIKYFRTGRTGRIVFTLPRSTGAAGVLQSFCAGAGGAVYGFDVSLDAVHWTAVATITHLAADGDTQSATISPNWAYASANISSIGAATALTIKYSA